MLVPQRVLYDRLLVDNASLADELDDICQEAVRIWQERLRHEYTAHGEDHIAQVEANLGDLTRHLQTQGNALSAKEIFILLSACYLHDVAMQLSEDDARANHAEYVFDLIINSSPQVPPGDRRITLPIRDNNARRAIALVAKGHWTQFALELPQTDYIRDDNSSGRLRLLGCLLAMADLLDTSPIRATYYRSFHRLQDLPPLSELHQVMHALARGISIGAPVPALSADLRFELTWRGDDDTIRDISDWHMHWIDSEWRRLSPVLYDESGGAVRWADPCWAKAVFSVPEEPLPPVSSEALCVLRAQREEQRRIDRDAWIEDFQKSVSARRAVVYLLRTEGDFDGLYLANWCEANARLSPDCRVARVAIPHAPPRPLADVVSIILEQWEEHLPRCGADEAVEQLALVTSGDEDRSYVTIVKAERYQDDRIVPLLEALMARPGCSARPARICLLLTPAARGPRSVTGGDVVRFDGSPLAREDIEAHLRTKWGYNTEDCSTKYARMESMNIHLKPGSIYRYIQSHCGFAAQSPPGRA